MAEIGVVHLVRRNNGLAPFERFLASYREHPAGARHDLIVIFKGFPFGLGTPAYDRLLADVPHRRMYLADYGLDLRPYFKAVAKLDHRYLCFLNSYSQILEGNWLAKLYRWGSAKGVGLVGATGSYQSFTTTFLERETDRAALSTSQRLQEGLRHVVDDPAPRVMMHRAAAWILGTSRLVDPARFFPPFPNYHIRTNAFLASHETLIRMRFGPVFFKLSAYMFESGRESLTNQITRLGLRPILVGRDGTGYEKEDWHLANIFRQSKQENLLIADNQTRLYDRADAESRAELSRLAWGEHARPA